MSQEGRRDSPHLNCAGQTCIQYSKDKHLNLLQYRKHQPGTPEFLRGAQVDKDLPCQVTRPAMCPGRVASGFSCRADLVVCLWPDSIRGSSVLQHRQ